MPKKQDLLLIFARNPEKGKVKTRLAAGLGDEAALKIYEMLLQHTEKVTRDLDSDKIVYYSEDASEESVFKDFVYRKELQKGTDLGDRMKNAFSEGFTEGYKKIIIIGTDLYDLQQKDLETAFSKLDTYDYVIGPAEDGGYYLMGMKQLNSALFSNKSWSTKNVLSESLRDLKDENVYLLEEKNDIDVIDDLDGIQAFEKYLKLP